jgi:hypothetical protein
MNGKQLQDGAVKLARTKGYLAAHFTNVHDSRGFFRTAFAYDAKGFPDLILVGRKLVAVEVKGDGDRLRPEQAAWIAAFHHAGVDTMILTSKRWRDGEFERLLDA